MIPASRHLEHRIESGKALDSAMNVRTRVRQSVITETRGYVMVKDLGVNEVR